MIIIVINSSKKKSFRTSKRIITEVIQPITNRVSIGDIPKRVILSLIKNLKFSVTKGTSIQIFIESKNIGFRGFKCIEIGVKKQFLEPFVMSSSLIDKELILAKLIPSI